MLESTAKQALDKTLYVLTGQTAVGKTDLAIDWAIKNDAEILSCDSTLVYKGMDIGTAKPSAEQMARVRHHGIDLLEPRERVYSVHDYEAYAKDCIEEIHDRGKRVLITGGSGFYLKAFYKPITDGLEVPEEVTKEVMAMSDEEATQALLERDPKAAEEVHMANPRRIRKALERAWASGRSVAELKAEFELMPCPFEKYKKQTTLLVRPTEVLRERIALRADLMLEAGFLDEVRKLETDGLRENSSAASAIGYRECLEFLDGRITDAKALREKIVLNTQKLLAKQRKFFRHQIPIDRRVDLEAIDQDSPLGSLFEIN